jgi:hypothetical protein
MEENRTIFDQYGKGRTISSRAGKAFNEKELPHRPLHMGERDRDCADT